MVSAGSGHTSLTRDPANPVPLSRHSKLYAKPAFFRVFSEKQGADL
jgi:hypothetical protein